MKKIFAIIAAVAALSLTSCQDWLDINHSPNSPGEELATVDMAFPAAEMALCARYGDIYRIIDNISVRVKDFDLNLYFCFFRSFAFFFAASSYSLTACLNTSSLNGSYM